MDPDTKQSFCTIGQCWSFYSSEYADGKICESIEIMSQWLGLHWGDNVQLRRWVFMDSGWFSKRNNLCVKTTVGWMTPNSVELQESLNDAKFNTQNAWYVELLWNLNEFCAKYWVLCSTSLGLNRLALLGRKKPNVPTLHGYFYLNYYN